MRGRARYASLLGGAVAGAVGLAALAPGGFLRDPEPAPAAGATKAAAADDLTARIGRLQSQLRERPDDARGWAGLGGDYVEQARRTGDPSYYPKAEGALERSLRLRPKGNATALTGMGALAAARHEFARAREWAGKAKRADPYEWPAYGVLTDAAVELGDYTEAGRVLQRMLDLRPGVASFTRAGHLLELRGQNDRAAEALGRALNTASTPAEVAYCHYRLAELAWNIGDPRQALAAYESSLSAAPGYVLALAGRAKARAALGLHDQAVADYTAAIGRAPLPQFLVELGELQQSRGRTKEAAAQFALLSAEQRLQSAGGVVDDLTAGQYESDHGDPRRAVRSLTEEWKRRRSVDVADALGWALHRAGRSRAALEYAGLAARLGGRNALHAFHRGEIERSLGNRAAARHHLKRALAINPHFSPLRAGAVKSALERLGP